MRVLVTGGRGFVGGYVADYLKNSFEVCGFSPDSLVVNKDDVIVHCAAAAGPWHSVQKIAQSNIELPRELIERYKPRLFIFMSSISVYGDVETPIVSETTKFIDPEPYGQSKAFCEALLDESDTPSVALRLPGIVGPHCQGRNWLVRLAQQLRAGENIALFNAAEPFNVAIHVHDIAKFVAKLIKNPPKGHEKMILAPHGTISVRNAAQLLANELGVSLNFHEVSANRPSFTLSPKYAMERFGFAPMSIQETICRYAEDIKNEQ